MFLLHVSWLVEAMGTLTDSEYISVQVMAIQLDPNGGR